MSESAAFEAPARRLGPGRPRSRESEDAILDATMRFLGDLGYAGLTTDRIAAEARVSKSTIYRRWPSKEHLVIAAFDRLPPLEIADRGDAAEELVALILQFIDVLHSTPLAGVLPTLVAERAHNPELAAVLDPVIERRRLPAKAIFERAVRRRDLPESTDIELAVDAILGPLMLRLFFLPGDVGPPAMRALVTLVLAGLGRRGGT